MIQASGTKAEWEELACQIKKEYNSKEGSISEVIMRFVESKDWITKPEW